MQASQHSPEDLHATIQNAAGSAVQAKLETHRKLGQRIAVQKPDQSIVVDTVENILSENEQNPPHVA